MVQRMVLYPIKLPYCALQIYNWSTVIKSLVIPLNHAIIHDCLRGGNLFRIFRYACFHFLYISLLLVGEI